MAQAVLLALMLLGCDSHLSPNHIQQRACIDDTSVVASVDGAPIVVAEIRQQMPSVRVAVQGYFRNHFDAEIDAAFWTSEFGIAEHPSGALRESALLAAISVKVEQLLMQHERIVQDASYTAFLRSLNEENRKRADAFRLGTPIYGPQVESASNYFEYLQSLRVLKLKQQMSGLNGSDRELKAEYDALEGSALSRGKIVQTEEVHVAYVGPTAPTKDEARTLLMTLRELIVKGTTSGPWASARAGGQYYTYDKKTFDGSGRRSGWSNIVESRALNLAPNETSELIDTGSEFVISHCLAISDLGAKSFAEMRPALQHAHIERAFDRLVKLRTRQSNVDVARNILGCIPTV